MSTPPKKNPGSPTPPEPRFFDSRVAEVTGGAALGHVAAAAALYARHPLTSGRGAGGKVPLGAAGDKGGEGTGRGRDGQVGTLGWRRGGRPRGGGPPPPTGRSAREPAAE